MSIAIHKKSGTGRKECRRQKRAEYVHKKLFLLSGESVKKEMQKSRKYVIMNLLL